MEGLEMMQPEMNQLFDSYYSGRRVFVTGHTGFKGSWLTQWLLLLGAEVTGYSIGVPTQPSLYEPLGLSGQIRDVRGDVRPSNVYGLPVSLKGFRRWSLVQHGFCREAIMQGSITLRTTGTQLRNFVAAEDLCEIVERMTDDDARSVPPVHVAGPGPLSIRELAGKIQECVTAQTGKRVDITYGTDESASSEFQFCARVDAHVIPLPQRRIDEFVAAFCRTPLQCAQARGEM